MLNKKALAASVSAPPAIYPEDVFSTYLYTGTGAALTITNDIDLDGEGGLTWIKSRSAATDNQLFDTVRGATNELISNSTAAQAADADTLTAFNADGFSLGADSNVNTSAATYCSWSFRKQPKFFDIVTWTGTGSARTVAHNLGSEPGMIIVKKTSDTGSWEGYHRSIGATKTIRLNSTGEEITTSGVWNDTAPTSTVFTVGTGGNVNTSGETYVAYLFAHDAGGFGTAGTDNVISCGSYSGSGAAGNPITLGYEPQFMIVKRTNAVEPWFLYDVMRGDSLASQIQLQANFSGADFNGGGPIPTATGFNFASGDSAFNGSGSTYIYMAIRRPMKVPTTGTEVFGLNARTGTGADATVTGGQVDDAVLVKNRGAVASLFSSRLTGTGYLVTSTTAAEVAAGTTILQANPWDVMDGVKVGTTSTITNASANTYINYLFRRAPGFMDVVCYTGTGSARTLNHNLTVAPELIIVKTRSNAESWFVYSSSLGNTKYVSLNSDSGESTSANLWNSTSPTSSVFSVGISAGTNFSTYTFVAYLFATCAGVSKVGSYTGNGGTQAIACGFTGGARFVLIKRTDSTGDWYVYDTARGMTLLTDPYLELNTADAEAATLGSVTTTTGGFTVDASILAAINTNAASYIFLAIA
jgi:hypothetical protein